MCVCVWFSGSERAARQAGSESAVASMIGQSVWPYGDKRRVVMHQCGLRLRWPPGHAARRTHAHAPARAAPTRICFAVPTLSPPGVRRASELPLVRTFVSSLLASVRKPAASRPPAPFACRPVARAAGYVVADHPPRPGAVRASPIRAAPHVCRRGAATDGVWFEPARGAPAALRRNGTLGCAAASGRLSCAGARRVG